MRFKLPYEHLCEYASTDDEVIESTQIYKEFSALIDVLDRVYCHGPWQELVIV